MQWKVEQLKKKNKKKTGALKDQKIYRNILRIKCTLLEMKVRKNLNETKIVTRRGREGKEKTEVTTMTTLPWQNQISC